MNFDGVIISLVGCSCGVYIHTTYIVEVVAFVQGVSGVELRLGLSVFRNRRCHGHIHCNIAKGAEDIRERFHGY